MSAHDTLTLHHFKHILQTALNARVNQTLVISWMVMEPKHNEQGFAAAISWPVNADKATQDDVGQAAQEASRFIQEKNMHVPDYVEQSLHAQAIEIKTKSAHEHMAAQKEWTDLRST